MSVGNQLAPWSNSTLGANYNALVFMPEFRCPPAPDRPDPGSSRRFPGKMTTRLPREIEKSKVSVELVQH